MLVSSSNVDALCLTGSISAALHKFRKNNKASAPGASEVSNFFSLYGVNRPVFRGGYLV